jgi:hypothetical protein
MYSKARIGYQHWLAFRKLMCCIECMVYPVQCKSFSSRHESERVSMRNVRIGTMTAEHLLCPHCSFTGLRGQFTFFNSGNVYHVIHIIS